MKQLITFLLLVSLAGCATNNDIEGYWYIENTDTYHDVPMLLYFQNDLCIDYSSANIDTFRRVKKLFSNVIHLIDENDSLCYTVQKKIESLRLRKNTKNDNSFLYKKSTKDEFVFEYLKNDTVKISLPSGQGTNHRGKGLLYYYCNPIYIELSNDSILYNYCNTQLNERSLFKHLYFSNNEKMLSESICKKSITIVADKNVKYKNIMQIKQMSSVAGYWSVNYILKSKNYHNLNRIRLRLPTIDEESYLVKEYFNTLDTIVEILYKQSPPPPPPLGYYEFPQHGMLISFINDTLKLDIMPFQFQDLKSKIQKEDNRGKSFIAYYVENNATYQNYITLIDSMVNIFYDLRDDYLMQKYGVKFRGLQDEKLQKEARKKFPVAMMEVDSIWYYGYLSWINDTIDYIEEEPFEIN